MHKRNAGHGEGTRWASMGGAAANTGSLEPLPIDMRSCSWANQLLELPASAWQWRGSMQIGKGRLHTHHQLLLHTAAATPSEQTKDGHIKGNSKMVGKTHTPACAHSLQRHQAYHTAAAAAAAAAASYNTGPWPSRSCRPSQGALGRARTCLV